MSVAEICRLPVWRIADKDSVLFLWATGACLREAIAVMKAWGFEYKMIAFVWLKMTKNNKPAMGMGSYTRTSTELVLLGKQGKGLPRVSKGVRQEVLAQRTRHSAKPPEIRDRIVELYGSCVRNVELFAREHTPGWDGWGNELVDDELPHGKKERLQQLRMDLRNENRLRWHGKKHRRKGA
jgi:site-specific DNA-methyltransferase (adenine-specific)